MINIKGRKIISFAFKKYTFGVKIHRLKMGFSNLNDILQKGPLMKDWVFRLGSILMLLLLLVVLVVVVH